MFDTAIFVFTLMGIGLGVWRGFFRTIITLLATYVPMIFFAIYFDEITNFIDITIANMGDSNTAALAGLGTFAGIIAIVAFAVGSFLGTRTLLQIMRFHESDRWDRFFGAFAGAAANSIMASLVYFMMFTASPVTVTMVAKGSVWAQALNPIHVLVYPHYRRYVLNRSHHLHQSVATNGLADTLLHGVSLTQLGAVAKGNSAVVTDAVFDKVKSVIADLNIEELQQTISQIDASEISPEDIDRQIALEEARRQAFIRSQLGDLQSR